MTTETTASPPRTGSWRLSPFFTRPDAPPPSAGARAVRARLRTAGPPVHERFFVDVVRELGTPWDDAPAVTR